MLTSSLTYQGSESIVALIMLKNFPVASLHVDESITDESELQDLIFQARRIVFTD